MLARRWLSSPCHPAAQNEQWCAAAKSVVTCDCNGTSDSTLVPLNDGQGSPGRPHLHGLFLEFRSVILSFRHFPCPLSGKILLILLSGNSGAPQLFIWLWRAESISAALTACGGGHCACKSGSGIRSPSRSKPAPVSATAKAPPHQTASGDVASSAPPIRGAEGHACGEGEAVERHV